MSVLSLGTILEQFGPAEFRMNLVESGRDLVESEMNPVESEIGPVESDPPYFLLSSTSSRGPGS